MDASEADFEADEADVQRYKAAIHFTVGELLEHASEDQSITFSRQFVATLADLTFKQFGTVAQDLEAFAKHAKRTTVSVDDVKLVARRKQEVYNNICDMSEALSAAHDAEKAQKKAKKAKTSAAPSS